MQNRALCVHAHFYQPPREDPLTGEIPAEISAAPYQNWNQRIHAECYKPNADLRNYEHISFNIGPTLAQWMDTHAPATFYEIVAQDRANVRRYGIGNAMAQAYNHTILPLDARKDKVTQVYWGVSDFRHRFGRPPRGMWLPEAAADLETLEVLALHGIDYTILAPWQAASDDIDYAEPYLVNLPDQRKIAIFFYERDLSARVSFDPIATSNADLFASDILLNAFHKGKLAQGKPELILVASDGELYGHHQSFRDRFLSRLVDGASSSLGIEPTYPALWLQRFPPGEEIGIRDFTSWSCHHGIERWRGACPCAPAGEWKEHVRRAFDKLAAALDQLYLDVTSPHVPDPWGLRNLYIHVLLGQMTLDDLIGNVAVRTLTSQQRRRIQLMLSAQRERQRMFTSCGWFFDEFDRIEPRNNLAYAAQAAHLAGLATGIDLREIVQTDLSQVFSQETQQHADQLFAHRLDLAQELSAGSSSPFAIPVE